MKNEIDVAFDVDVTSDVVANELEVAIAEVCDVGDVARSKIVDADDVSGRARGALRRGAIR